jgi:hypothetical protein
MSVKGYFASPAPYSFDSLSNVFENVPVRDVRPFSVQNRF